MHVHSSGQSKGLTYYFLNNRAFDVAAILAIHLIYFILAISEGNIFTADSSEYLYQAENIWKHGSFYAGDLRQDISPIFHTLRPPLYSLFILIIKLLIDSDHAVLLVQNILSFITLITFQGFINARLTYRQKLPMVAICLLLYPTWTITANMVMSDLLFSLILLFSAINFWSYLQYGSNKALLWHHILLALAVLTKPVLLYFWPFTLVLSALLFFQKRQWQILAFASILPLAIFGWSLHNKVSTGHFHFSSSKSVNLVLFNATSYLNYTEGIDASRTFMSKVHQSAQNKVTMAEQLNAYEKHGKEVILKNPVNYLLLHGQLLGRFFLSPGRETLMEFLQLKDTAPLSLMLELKLNGAAGLWYWLKNIPPMLLIYSIIITAFNLTLLALTFAYFMLVKDRLIWKTFLFCLIGYISLVSAAGVTLSRLRMPIFLLMVFCAIMAVAHFTQTRKKEALTSV